MFFDGNVDFTVADAMSVGTRLGAEGGFDTDGGGGAVEYGIGSDGGSGGGGN